MANWRKYRSSKIVTAAKITSIDPLRVGDEAFFPTEPGMADRARIGWYAIRYADDFRVVSPPDVFEAGYTEEISDG